MSFRLLARLARLLDCQVGEMIQDLDLDLPQPNRSHDETVATEIGEIMLEGYWTLGSGDDRRDLTDAMNAVALLLCQNDQPEACKWPPAVSVAFVLVTCGSFWWMVGIFVSQLLHHA